MPPFYRLDKFIVPEAAREEFLPRLHASREFLRKLPGFVRDFVMEQNPGTGVRHYVAFAEWTDAAALDVACAAIPDWHQSRPVDWQEMNKRLGIQSDSRNYFPLAV